MHKTNPPLLKLVCTVALCLSGVMASTFAHAAQPPQPAIQPAVLASAMFPPSSSVDFTATLQAPVGGHGFLGVGKDGHFEWADGTRARFWGVNISSTRLNLPDDQIEAVVKTLASAGTNMVRLEAIDNRNCLLGRTDALVSYDLDDKYLDRVDKWIDTLRKHGIYYYLDLLDFRTFKAGDKVVNAEDLDRAARPYAIFDTYLIQLQQEYAAKLLTHRNRYSGLRAVDDPALALVEICNEHGFFLYPEKLEKLSEPYATNLKSLWNHWLQQHYGNLDGVVRAWATAAVPQPLRPDETLDMNGVDLPMLATPPDAFARQNAIPRKLPMRMHDGVRFLAELQRSYFKQMRDALRQIGLKVPVTGVVSGGEPADVASVAAECDFTAENWYGETDGLDPAHPAMRFVGGRNSLRADSPWGLAPSLASLRWYNKPVCIREWGSSWPNRARAVSVPQMAAYAALQDVDCLLLFGYQTNIDSDGSTPDSLSDLAFQCDPTVWGLFAIVGQAYLKGAIHRAPTMVNLVYPDDRLNTWPNHTGDAYRLSWSVRVNSTPGDKLSGEYSFVPAGNRSDLASMRDILDRLSRDNVTLNSDFSNGAWKSETGEISLFAKEGRMEVEAPTFCALAGELTPGKVYDLGAFRISTPSPMAAFVAYSLDGKPLSESKHVIMKMVTRAGNTGEVLEKAPAGSMDNFVLRKHGTGPVVTFGRPSTTPVKVWMLRDGKDTPDQDPVLTLGMIDGTWEAEIIDGTARFVNDTPGIAAIFGAGVTDVSPRSAASNGNRDSNRNSPPQRGM